MVQTTKLWAAPQKIPESERAPSKRTCQLGQPYLVSKFGALKDPLVSAIQTSDFAATRRECEFAKQFRAQEAGILSQRLHKSRLAMNARQEPSEYFLPGPTLCPRVA
jgi:hypothetical protein